MQKIKNNSQAKTQYSCQECGWSGSRWNGRCPQCSAWNSLSEELIPSSNPKRASLSKKLASPLSFSEISASSLSRFLVGIKEFDRVIGGGLVPGSFLLIGGDPGVGKSTLILQVCGGLAASNKKVLYISAEESAQQTAFRAKRLKIDSPNLLFLSESSLDRILEQTRKTKPSVLIVDSIQTVYLDELSSAPGTVSQVRESASRLMTYAKSHDVTIFIIGHVTKDGNLAGPRVLEHLVDTVLSFEGDPHYPFRILRSQKNRFGPSQELALFDMGEGGLEEVSNPSQFFLREKSEDSVGSIVFSAREGSRSLLCEIQSLTLSTFLPLPRRTTLGLDIQRIHMIAAVLDKYLGTELGKRDLFVNLVGGLKINEPASDLAVAMSILSSRYKKGIDKDSCFFGELGLTGELRACHFARERIQEAEKLGFKNVYLPLGCKAPLKEQKFKIQLHFKKHLTDFEFFKNKVK